MPTSDTDDRATIVDAFLDVIRPIRKPKPGEEPKQQPARVTEDEDYVAMMLRMVRALEARAISNPAILAHVELLRQRLSEVTAVAIAANADRFAVNPFSGASMAECAKVLGVSKQAASQRRAIGNRIMGERIEAAGAAKFAEARRERDAVTRAEEYATEQLGAERVEQLAEYRARHLRAVA
jgi:sirohydrochlorin ferrochelatase